LSRFCDWLVELLVVTRGKLSAERKEKAEVERGATAILIRNEKNEAGRASSDCGDLCILRLDGLLVDHWEKKGWG